MNQEVVTWHLNLQAAQYIINLLDNQPHREVVQMIQQLVAQTQQCLAQAKAPAEPHA